MRLFSAASGSFHLPLFVGDLLAQPLQQNLDSLPFRNWTGLEPQVAHKSL
jgi:hypothetical protein